MKDPLADTKPVRGRIFTDDRGDEILQVVHGGDDIVVLRSEYKHHNRDRHVYRFEDRLDFDRQIDSGRLEHTPDADIEFPDITTLTPENIECSEEQPDEEPGGNSPDSSITEYTDEDSTSTKNSADEENVVEDSGDDNSTKMEDASEEDDETQTNQSSLTQSGEREDEDVEVEESNVDYDWTDVKAIGKATRKNLHQDGFTTLQDVRDAEVEELETTTGVGPKAAENLKSHAE